MAPLILMVAIFISQAQAQTCDHGDIRLEDGPTMFEGRVEVCLDGQWVTVCNDFWGSNEIAVVCRQLGFQVTGMETFIDLRMPGGPNTGMDTTNCSGSEQRLVDCSFSDETSDCNAEIHKVGVRCHEERKPRSIALSIQENSKMLSIEWEEPALGITNEQVQAYNLECSFAQGGDEYTLKHSARREVLEFTMPIMNLHSDSGYNCCVEAVFETYSSKLCAFESSTTIQEAICRSDRTIAAVAGVLTCFILILLILLTAIGSALVYTWLKLRRSQKPKSHTSRETTAEAILDVDERALGNPTYGAKDTVISTLPDRVATSHKKTTWYSSDGPEYEPVQPSKLAMEEEVSRNRNSLPTPYETPVSGVQTIS